jgi:hypothetical protein
MGKAKTRGGGWGKRKRKRNRRPSSDLTLGKGRRADRRSPCFPGRKALLRVLWHLRPSSRRRRGRRGRAEGKGREGERRVRLGRAQRRRESGPTGNRGLAVNGFGSASPLRVATCNRVRRIVPSLALSLASPARKGKAQVALAGSSLIFPSQITT